MIIRDTHQMENGDRLTRTDFERLCELHNLENAELLNGVVHMAAAVRFREHGQPHARILLWLGTYAAGNPEIKVGDNASIRIDEKNEPQPDALMFRLGGDCVIAQDGYLQGPPQLVVEIAASSVGIDSHDKKQLYLDAGVGEYLLWRTEDQAVDWWYSEKGQWKTLPEDVSGCIESRQFPGLILDVPSLLAGNMQHVLDQLKPDKQS